MLTAHLSVKASHWLPPCPTDWGHCGKSWGHAGICTVQTCRRERSYKISETSVLSLKLSFSLCWSITVSGKSIFQTYLESASLHLHFFCLLQATAISHLVPCISHLTGLFTNPVPIQNYIIKNDVVIVLCNILQWLSTAIMINLSIFYLQKTSPTSEISFVSFSILLSLLWS